MNTNRTSKEIPILFSTEMVRAILAGRKTMTRRTRGLEAHNKTPHKWRYDGIDFRKSGEDYHWFEKLKDDVPQEEYYYTKCQYGQRGDILWVRESFVNGMLMDKDGYFKLDEQGNYINEVFYKASDSSMKWYDGKSDFPSDKIPWKPSIHMPKEACRIWLQVESIKCERLHDISEEDARKEGVFNYEDGTFKNYFKQKGLRAEYGVECLLAKGSFESLWHSINGAESWDVNPWVWVASFKVLSITGKPANL